MFDFIGNLIEGGIYNLIAPISQSIAQFLIPWVNAAITLWILAFGLATMRGEVQMPVMTFVWRAVKMTIILNLALVSGTYQTEILGTINTVTMGLMTAVTSHGFHSQCQINLNGSGHVLTGVYSFLDCQWDAANKVARAFDQAAIQTWGSGSILFIGKAIISVFMLVLDKILLTMGYLLLFMIIGVEFITVRVSLDIVLCLGSLFIACLAFEPTKRYFEGWLSKVVYCIILQVIFCLFLVVVAAVLDGFITKIFMTSNIDGWVQQLVSQALSSLASVMYILLVIGVLGWIFIKLPGIAAGLVGHSGGSSGLGAAATMVASRMLMRGGLPKLPGRLGGKIKANE